LRARARRGRGPAAAATRPRATPPGPPRGVPPPTALDQAPAAAQCRPGATPARAGTPVPPPRRDRWPPAHRPAAPTAPDLPARLGAAVRCLPLPCILVPPPSYVIPLVFVDEEEPRA